MSERPVDAGGGANTSRAESDSTPYVEPEPRCGLNREGASYCLGAVGRWLYLGIVFVYLLAMVGVLFEAHAYQQLVARLASADYVPTAVAPDDWRRIMLLAVRDADRERPPCVPGDPPPEGGDSAHLKPIVDMLVRDRADKKANTKEHQLLAETLLRAYQDLDRYRDVLMPFASAEDVRCGRAFGFSGKDLAVAGTAAVDLLVVFIMGAIGSLIYITQYLLEQVIHGRRYDAGAGRSWAWFLFRPVFGVTIAFALYLLYKAGQIALGGGSDTALSSDVNLPVLSTLSLFAGLMSWQVLDMVKESGSRFLTSARRGPRWATGLATATRNANLGVPELAVAVGASEEQVERWLELIDSVPLEMQERISAYLESEPGLLFSDRTPALRFRSRKANGLEALMHSRGLDAGEIARRLNVPADLVRAWADRSRPVAERYQRDLALLLGTSLKNLFGEPPAAGSSQDTRPAGTDTSKPEAVPPDAAGGAHPPPGGLWAPGLRFTLADSPLADTAELAARLQVDRQTVRNWAELRSPVPLEQQGPLLEALEADASLFSQVLPRGFQRVSDGKRMLEAIKASPRLFGDGQEQRITAFAELLDVAEDDARSWISGGGSIAPATAHQIRMELQEARPETFLEPVG